MLYIAPGTLMLVSADTDIREQHALANVMDKPVAYGANACTCEDCGPELQTDVDQADTDADEPQALDVDIKPVACGTHTQGDCAPELWMDIDQMHVGTTGQHHAANHHHEPPAICTDAVHPHAEMLPTRRDRDGQGSKILGQCTDSDSPPIISLWNSRMVPMRLIPGPSVTLQQNKVTLLAAPLNIMQLECVMSMLVTYERRLWPVKNMVNCLPILWSQLSIILMGPT